MQDLVGSHKVSYRIPESSFVHRHEVKPSPQRSPSSVTWLTGGRTKSGTSSLCLLVLLSHQTAPVSPSFSDVRAALINLLWRA